MKKKKNINNLNTNNRNSNDNQIKSGQLDSSTLNNEDKKPSTEELHLKIEEKIKVGLKNEEEKNHDIGKYKDFNLTNEIEKNYEKYQEDKDTEYFQNMDDLENDEKYKNKQKKKSKREEKEEEYNREWDEKVSKMFAHDLLTFNVDKGDYHSFFENVQEVPLTITSAFYVHNEKGKIDFLVIDSKGKDLQIIKSKNRGFYEFEVKEPGRYKFILDNQKVLSKY